MYITCVILKVVQFVSAFEDSCIFKDILTQIRTVAFSALTLLVGHLEEHPARKELSDRVLVWLSVWSVVQMICIWSS